MRNPWLDIPLGDYEAHMAQPDIGQAVLIADQLQILVAAHDPTSVAVVGCAGGNGLERLIGTRVTRVAGVDINPDYVNEARRRYGGRIPGLTLHVRDIQGAAQMFEPVDLIYAALVFEYVDGTRTMSALRRHCKLGGVLTVLFQVPHDTLPEVSPSPFSSLLRLEPAMHQVSEEELRSQAVMAGFTAKDSRSVVSAGGKAFVVARFGG